VGIRPRRMLMPKNLSVLGMALKETGPTWTRRFNYSYWDYEVMSRSWTDSYKTSVAFFGFIVRSRSWTVEFNEEV